ncbi:MAG: energy-coupling factor transporter ATPase [Clostridia bacterium]|nr:energy-coupling factor transporter ATPase [Clostridia bacterium]
MDKIIELKNVSFVYDTQEEQKPALRNVSLDVRRGEFLAVIGHNGSGKSTLAKLLNAILLPTEGQVLVEGMDTADEDLVYEIRRRVGMVFQNPDNQIVATIVEDDVAFGPENLGVPPAEIRQRVDDALRAVGMYEFRGAEPHKLSGGQKQRVAVAGVIAMRTDCIIFDESTAMIDPKGRREVLETAKRLCREMGITVVMITHFMEEAVQADRVVVLDSGRVAAEGVPSEVFADSALLRRTGLELPFAAKLAGKIRTAGVPLPDGLLTPDSVADALFAAAQEAEVI